METILTSHLPYGKTYWHVSGILCRRDLPRRLCVEQLRTLRETKGMSQAKLAVLADMNPVTLWRYETGQRSPTVEQLERLADVLGIEVGDLFPKDQDPLPLDADTRRAALFEDAVAVAAGKWLEDLDQIKNTLSDKDNGSLGAFFEGSKALALSRAAWDLINALNPHLLEGLHGEDVAYEKFMKWTDELGPETIEDLGRVNKLLFDVAKKAHEIWDASQEEEEDVSGNDE